MIFRLHQFSEKHGEGAWNDPSYNILTRQPRSLEPQALYVLWSGSTEEFSQNNSVCFKNNGIFQLTQCLGRESEQPAVPKWLSGVGNRDLVVPYLCGGESGLWSLRFVPCHHSWHRAPEAAGASIPGWVWGFSVLWPSGAPAVELWQGERSRRLDGFPMEAQGTMTSQQVLRDVSSARGTWGVWVLPLRLRHGDFRVFWTIKHKGSEKGLGSSARCAWSASVRSHRFWFLFLSLCYWGSGGDLLDFSWSSQKLRQGLFSWETWELWIGGYKCTFPTSWLWTRKNKSALARPNPSSSFLSTCCLLTWRCAGTPSAVIQHLWSQICCPARPAAIPRLPWVILWSRGRGWAVGISTALRMCELSPCGAGAAWDQLLSVRCHPSPSTGDRLLPPPGQRSAAKAGRAI